MKFKKIKSGFVKAKDSVNNAFIEAMVDLQTGNLPKETKADRIIFSLASATGILTCGTGVAFAAPADPFSAAESVLKKYYTKLLEISTLLAAFLIVIALIASWFNTDGQDAKKEVKWVKRIVLGWVIINALGFFVAIGKDLTNGLRYE